MCAHFFCLDIREGCVAVPTTILIVNDNDFVRAAMRKILEARAIFRFVEKPLMDGRR